jgi:4-amino-4-deoxy-L-arabinose transferase-like glycosyltransferase
LTHERGPIVGLFGAVMLLLNVGMVASARQALTDMVLIFFTTLATFSFWLGFHGKGPTRRWLWVSYIAMAFGTLTKGPLGILVPLLAIVPYLTVTKQWRRFWQHGFPLRGFALYLALALPWYAVMLMLHGSSYSSDVQTHTFSRFLNPFYGWGGTVLFYVPVLLWGFFPWSAFLPFALYEQYALWKQGGVRVVNAGLHDRDSEGQHQNLELFAGLWFLAVFIFFSLGATRLPHYIGPLYPAAAIVAASYWARASQDPAPFGLRVALWIMIVLGVLLALVFAALPSVFDAFAEKLVKTFPYATHFHFDAGPYAASVLLLAGMVVVGYLGISPSRRAGVFGVAGTTIALVILIMLHLTLPLLSRYLLAPPQELAFTAGLSLEPADRLIFYGPNRPSAVFYAKRKVIVVRLNEEENIGPYVKEPGRTMVVLPASLRNKLPEEASTLPVIQERFGWILLAETNRSGESLSDHAK